MNATDLKLHDLERSQVMAAVLALPFELCIMIPATTMAYHTATNPLPVMDQMLHSSNEPQVNIAVPFDYGLLDPVLRETNHSSSRIYSRLEPDQLQWIVKTLMDDNLMGIYGRSHLLDTVSGHRKIHHYLMPLQEWPSQYQT